MSRKPKNIYYLDTESTAFDEEKGTRVYLWCAVDKNNIKYHGFDIKSEIEFLQKVNGTVWVHNLKHELSFIHDYCLHHKIKLKILERKGNVYSVRLNRCTIKDFFNFVPLSLEMISKTFSLVEFKKYKLENYNQSYTHTATDEEIEYCYNDCLVLKSAIEQYFKEMSELLTAHGYDNASAKIAKSLTISSVAYEAFTEKISFNSLCPKTTPELYRLVSRSYIGGFVYSNNKGILSDVIMIDNNSMYPDQYRNCKLPIGLPFNENNLDDCLNADFSVVNILIRYDLKPNYVPIIGSSGYIYGNATYFKTSHGKYEEMTISNIDLKLYMEFYEVDIIFNWGLSWKCVYGLFTDYCDMFMKIKEKSKGTRRFIAKQMLNRPYGKLAMNGISDIYGYVIDNGVVSKKTLGAELKEDLFNYLPQAIAITAHARKLLLETATKIGWEHVLYCDTDSIKCTSDSDLSDIYIDDTALGAWKIEGHAELFKTIAPKKYIYYENEQITVTCAGFNKGDVIDWVNDEIESDWVKDPMSDKLFKKASRADAINIMNKFDKGLTLNVRHSKVVKGGRVIVKEPKTMK